MLALFEEFRAHVLEAAKKPFCFNNSLWHQSALIPRVVQLVIALLQNCSFETQGKPGVHKQNRSV